MSYRSPFRRPLGPALVLASLAVGCGLVSGPTAGDGAHEAPPASPSELSTAVLHRDARTGTPSFVWFGGERDGAASAVSRPRARFASLEAAQRELAPHLARAFELKGPATTSLAHVATSGEGQGGPVVVRFAQRVGGLEVFRAGANVVLTKDLSPIAASGSLVTKLAGADAPFALDEAAAASAALAHVTGGAAPSLSSRGVEHAYRLFTANGLAAPLRVKRVLHPTNEALVPAYYVEVQIARGPARSLVVAADDARVLFQNDLVRNDAFSYRVWADAETLTPFDGPQGNGFAPHPTGKPDRVKLSYVPTKLVALANVPFSKNDPWLPSGATESRGNNVDAYADLGGGDGFSGLPDVRAAVSAPGIFDHEYDTSKSPGATDESKQASVTQLFYVLNFLHDAYYDAGFDEKLGNHQGDNYGRGGFAGDRLLAEAQDQSGRNNANAMVPGDGASPRIQMFVFSGASTSELVVNAPAGIAGTKPVGIASGFGADAFDLTGDVVLASDGQGADVADACEPLDIDVTGKIVLAHRGLCSFAQKAQNAQAAGAIGCIIANVASSTAATTPPFMGGTASGISIPLLSVALADGQALEAAAGTGGTNVRMHRSVGADLDGGLDTSIIAHEWGHVLSGRLVGDGNGLTTNQAGGLGEGWGDFVALLTTARPAAGESGTSLFSGVYANGSYATSGSGDDIYFGTRRVPYSVDLTKNPLTFKHIENGVALPASAPISFGEDGSFNAEVHNTGEVWATMLWECWVALARDGRFALPEAQARMRRYLVAALAATPVDPTLLEARDALLAVAYAADAKDFQTFFDAFARRGAGAGAKGPAKASASNGPVVESYSSAAALEVQSLVLTDDVLTCDHDGILDEGEQGSVTLTVKNVGSKLLSGAFVELVPKTEGFVVEGETRAAIPSLAPFEDAKVSLKPRFRGGEPTVPTEFVAVLSDPALRDPVRVTVTARYETDEAPATSALDRVDTTRTSWKTKSTGDFGPTPWARVKEKEVPDNTLWTVPDALEVSDQRLTSAPFTIEGTTFSLAFRHKWSFRISRRRQTAIDGGVVEVSTDGGKTWSDAEKYGKPAYNVALDTAGRGDNVLKGRNAFGQTSEGYPKAWVPAKIDITLPSHPESVMVRFRVGTGTGFTASDGWFLDDIEVVGATANPFYGFVRHQDACDPAGPTADAGLPLTVRSGALVTLAGSATHPAEAPLAYAWMQKAGPSVELGAADSLAPTFTAPAVTTPTQLAFMLRANDGKLVSAGSRVDVLVLPPEEVADEGCSCRTTGSPTSKVGGGAGAALAVLGALAARRRRRG